MPVKTKRIRKKTVKEIIEEVDMDPRRIAFANSYFDPLSNTYGNALQSALKAGFEPAYAKNITHRPPRWLLEITGKMASIDKVRRNINKFLDLDTYRPIMTAIGPYRDKKTKEFHYEENSELLKRQQDVTLFIAEKLVPEFKKKEKSEPTGQTVVLTQIIIKGADGSSIVYDANPQQITRDQADGEADRGIPEAA